MNLNAEKQPAVPCKKCLTGSASWARVLGLAAVRCLALSLPVMAQPFPKNVLVMASYQPGSSLEQEQLEGLRAELPPDVELIIDYLDAKRMASRKTYMDLYMGVMWSKYKNRRLDVIVALNDDAVRFVNYYRTNIFAHHPLVLCGSSTNMVSEWSNLTGWTGVFCEPDMEKTILLSLALHPHARKIHVITDRTTPGQRARERLGLAVEAKRFPVPVVLPDRERPWSFRRMVKYIRQIRPENLVFFAEFFQDNGGAVFLPHWLVPYLSNQSKAPIYTMQREAVGVGAVGGYVVNGERMGRAAGEMLRRVLAGEAPATIPPVVLEGEWLFDYRQLKRWGINEHRLPPGSQIIGRTTSFFERNKWILLAGGAIAGAELAVIALLLVNRAGRIRAQRALQASETRYRTLFEASDDMFTILDREGAILHANPATCRLLGYPLEELVGKNHFDLVAPGDRARMRTGLDLVLGGGRTVLEASCLTREGEEMPVEFLIQAFDCGERSAAVLFARSLSERIKIQRLTQEISERERQAIGHDIHDGLGQYLSALRFWCHRLESRSDGQRPPDAGVVAKLSQISTELVFEVRQLARSLVPLHMLSRTLESALRELLETNQRHFHVRTTLDYVLEERRLTPEAAAQLYRIAQEAIRNAVRHAGASAVEVALRSAGDGQGELIVENDGKPFHPPPEQRAGMGLAIMEQRARLIGGKFEIGPAGEQRTRLTCRFPIQPGYVEGGAAVANPMENSAIMISD